jgi:hypothetical protein
MRSRNVSVVEIEDLVESCGASPVHLANDSLPPGALSPVVRLRGDELAGVPNCNRETGAGIGPHEAARGLAPWRRARLQKGGPGPGGEGARKRACQRVSTIPFL